MISTVIAFIAGAIISPLVIVGGLWGYFRWFSKDSCDCGDYCGLEGLSPPRLCTTEVDLNVDVLDLQGQTYNLQTLCKGKYVFLKFFSTYYEPSLRELRSVNRIYRDFGEHIQFVCLSDESPDKLKKFLESSGMEELPVYQLSDELKLHVDSYEMDVTYLLTPESEILVTETEYVDWSHKCAVNYFDKLVGMDVTHSRTSEKIPTLCANEDM